VQSDIRTLVEKKVLRLEHQLDSKYLYGVTFGNNTFVGVGSYGKIVRSTDNGSTFNDVTSVALFLYYGVTFGNNTFLGVGNSGRIVRSTDNGSSFTLLNPDLDHLTDVSFGNNTFVGVSSIAGDIVRSTDNGSNWTSVDSGTTESLRGVAFKE